MSQLSRRPIDEAELHYPNGLVADLLNMLDGWKIDEWYEMYGDDPVGEHETKRGAMLDSSRTACESRAESVRTSMYERHAMHGRKVLGAILPYLDTNLRYQIVEVDIRKRPFVDDRDHTQVSALGTNISIVMRVQVGMRPLTDLRYSRVYHYITFTCYPGKKGKPTSKWGWTRPPHKEFKFWENYDTTRVFNAAEHRAKQRARWRSRNCGAPEDLVYDEPVRTAVEHCAGDLRTLLTSLQEASDGDVIIVPNEDLFGQAMTAHEQLFPEKTLTIKQEQPTGAER